MTLPAASIWLLASFLGGVALHADRLPFHYVLVAIVTCVWRALAEVRHDIRLPPAWLRGLLALALLAGVLIQYRTVNGLGPGTALLVSMGAVKLLETRGRRDRYIMVAVALFLMLSACLDRQSMVRAPFYLLLTWACCVSFIYIANPGIGLSTRQALRLTARALALSLPLALLLFVFFPRMAGQLWALPSQGSASTGLSDEMTPGGISALSESDEPAFRVRFFGAAPPPQLRYWRGPVLHKFDGYSWRRDRTQSYRSIKMNYGGNAYRYRITLEPHQRNWLFALETPQLPPSPTTYFSYDSQLLSAQPVTQAMSYELTSYTETSSSDELSVLGRRTETSLPLDRNPRSNALARQLRVQSADTAGFIRSVLALFRDRGFTYTLTPELLQQDSVDDFIFNTREGFCGHYASAFVSMMRAAGVPARVVTGYQGGEWNPIGDYFIVRQSDAHAWAEVWLEGEGWRRVDPTAVVSPERLTRGLLDLLPDAGTQVQRFARSLAWVQNLRQGWDAANTWWNDNVAQFNARAQLSILRRLGFDSPRLRQLGWIAAAGLATWAFAMLLWLARRAPLQRPDLLGRGYRTLCAWAGRRGLARAPDEGPRGFASRLQREKPELAARAVPLLEEYAELRYGRTRDDERRERVRRWLTDVRRLRFAA